MSERDPELDALWRRHSAETPPAALDDAIRAAAHRAVHAKPSTAPRARAPWPAWATFAAAASIGAIAIGVWQLQPRDIDETQVVASDTPARSVARQETARKDVAPSPIQAQTPAAGAPAVSSATDKTVSAETDARNDSRKPSPFPATRDAREGKEAPVKAETQIARSAPSTIAAAAGAQEERTLRARSEARGSVAKVAPDTTNESVAPPASVGGNDTARVVPAPTIAQPRMAQAPMAMKRSGDAATADAGSQQSQAAGNAVRANPGTLPSQAGSLAAPAPRQAARTVDDFVDTIRRALADHRDADAVTALAAMRTQFADADARLPADLRTWAARVPRAAN